MWPHARLRWKINDYLLKTKQPHNHTEEVKVKVVRSSVSRTALSWLVRCLTSCHSLLKEVLLSRLVHTAGGYESLCIRWLAASTGSTDPRQAVLVLPQCDKWGGGGPYPRRAQQVAKLCLQMRESDVCLCSQDKDDVLSSVLGEASMAAPPMSKSFSLICKSIQPRIDSYSGGDKIQDFRSFFVTLGRTCKEGTEIQRFWRV